MKQLNCPPCTTIEDFMNVLTSQLNEYYNAQFGRAVVDIKLNTGTKFHKITVNNSAWGFIARNNGVLKGRPYLRGDLLKAATHRQPAAISRGNVIEGCNYTPYGPNYLK
jgi:hypothetical protein